MLSHFLVKKKSARTPTKLWVTTPHLCQQHISSTLIQPPGRPNQPGSTLSFFRFHTYCGLAHKSYLVAMVFSNPPHVAEKLSVLVSLLIQKSVVYPRSWGWATPQWERGISPLSKGIQHSLLWIWNPREPPNCWGRVICFTKDGISQSESTLARQFLFFLQKVVPEPNPG